MALSGKSSHFTPELKPSGENPTHHLAVDIGQSILPPLVLEQESFMIDPQQVQDRRVEIVNVDRILGDVVREVVGASMDMALFHPRPGEHRREATRMMVAAALLFGSLGIDRSPELSSPDDKRVL